MADVYRIQAVINLGGNLAPELQKILRTMDRVEKEAKGVEKSLGRWASPIDRATASVAKFARAMGDARKNAHGVDREIAKVRSGLSGLKAPAGGMDREIAKWATALGRPLAEMRNMRTATQGVGSAARGVSRSLDSWAGKVSKAASAMRQMQRAASNVHLPSMPSGVGGGTVGGGRYRRHAGASRPSGHRGRQFGEHEGSHLAGTMGVYGGLNSLEYLIDQGAGRRREDLRAKNAGLTADERQKLQATAAELSRQYPSLSQLGIREQGRLLIPNVGEYSKAMEVLPEYLKGQVALQTTSGPEGGAKDMEHMARFIDLIGRSTSVPDTNRLIDGFVRARQLDPEAVKGNDYVNAAQSAGTAGKALSTDFWSTVMPAYFMQQGGARTGTDLASAFQNTIIGRGTDESLIKQSDEGYREGLEWKYDKNGKKKLIKKGHYVDETLRSSNPYEWAKKHAVPRMVAQGMLPEGYARGDFSQPLTDEQRVNSAKYLSERFSNRRGANFEAIAIQEMAQMEAIMARLRGAGGVNSALSDQKVDPYIAGRAIGTQAGNAASALAGQSIDDIVKNANRISTALGFVADALEKHPIAAQASFGAGTALVGGIATAGITALTLAAGATLSIPAITIGAGAAITIAALTIPFGAIADALGIPKQVRQDIKGAATAPGVAGAAWGDDDYPGNPLRAIERGIDRKLYKTRPGVGPQDFTAGLPGVSPADAKLMPNLPALPVAPGFGGAIPSLPRMGFEPAGGVSGGAAPAAIQQAGQAIGQAGANAATAAPSIAKAGEAAAASGAGFNTAATGASAAAAAAGAAGGALAGLAAKISGLGSMGLPGGVKAVGSPAAPGAGGGGAGATAPAAGAPKTSAVYRGGGAPIQVASTVNIDGRAVGRAVTRHQVAQLDTRNGTGRFDPTSAKTPVGFSEPVTA